jgi:hypothetical protein
MGNFVKICYLYMQTAKKYGWKPGMVALPRTWVVYNGGERCDMATGPCSCGATHYFGENR